MPQSAMDVKFETEFLRCFVLGKYGTGKSVFASTFPTPGYVFDFDQRIKTYRGLPWEYDSFAQTARGWVEAEKALKYVEGACKEGKYKSIVLDSTTTANDTAMGRALQIDPKRSNEGGPLWNVHYMIVKNLLGPFLRRVLSLQANIVFIGHWNIVTDPETGNIVSIDPIMTGDLSDKIPGLFDEVYTADSGKKGGEDVYYVRTTTYGHYRSRSTISGKLQLLPARIPNSYDAVMAHAKRAQELERIYREQGKEDLAKAKKEIKLELD